MEQINYFEKCHDTELMELFRAYKIKGSISNSSSFRKYLNKYKKTLSPNPVLLCEIDFLKTCGERFYERMLLELPF